MLTEEEFDTAYYLENNPDVAEAVRAKKIHSAYWHYAAYGVKERRLSRRLVDTKQFDGGFTSRRTRLAFYSMLASPDFMETVGHDDFRIRLAEGTADFQPSIILNDLS